jgi:hypothetical protein
MDDPASLTDGLRTVAIRPTVRRYNLGFYRGCAPVGQFGRFPFPLWPKKKKKEEGKELSEVSAPSIPVGNLSRTPTVWPGRQGVAQHGNGAEDRSCQ